MAGNYTVTTVFNNESGNQPSSQLDTNFTQAQAALCNLNTYGNYYVDTGAVNALAISVTAPQVVSVAAGLPLQVKVANTNTNAIGSTVTLNVNGTGAKNVLHADLSNIVAGELVIGAVLDLMYDGTQFQLMSTTSPVQSATIYRPMQSYMAVKAVNSARTSTTAQSNDNELVLTIGQAGTYELEVLLFFYEPTSGAGGIFWDVAFSGTTTTSTGWLVGSRAGTFTGGSSGFNTPASVSFGASYQPVSTTLTAPDFAFGTGIVVYTTTGVCALTWAQNTSNVNSTTMLPGSYLKAIRVA